MKILLFDMDGVLLEPRGYHRALQDTVASVGRLLGYKAVKLTADDITAFEAADVPSEWDSAAICAALLLENLWPEWPELRLPLVPDASVCPVHDVPSPHFQSFARALAAPDLAGMPPLKRAEYLLLHKGDSRPDPQRRAIRDVLAKARHMDGSLTHRIFQELVLGSQSFAATYGLTPSLGTKSYLLQYDRALLRDQERGRLLQWVQGAGQHAVIFTSRPSGSPDEHLSIPEAEIGARSVGLESLPILGLGGLSWLSARLGGDPESFRKPSPIHSLAALRLAIGDSVEGALEASAGLAQDRQADETWNGLQDAKVYVFEDTVSGLESMRRAKIILKQADVPLNVHPFGITDSGPKRRALEAAGAIVTPALSRALKQVPGF